MWNIGDRVWATRQTGEAAVPGTIRYIQGDRFFVIFDEGDDALLPAKQLEALSLAENDAVMLGKELGRVVGVEGERVKVETPDGVCSWMSVGRLKKPAAGAVCAMQKHGDAASALGAAGTFDADHEWQVGDPVLACYFDLLWYPAVVLKPAGEMVGVVFGDGARQMIAAEKLRPMHVSPGDRVEARFEGGPQFYPGVVDSVDGEVVHIRYDDGDEETTLARFVRMERDEWLPAAEKIDVGPGDRILACWHDGLWYPGILLSSEGKRVHVLFDDNDQAHLTWDRIRPLDLEVGDRVLCRLKAGPYYLPAEITEKKGERIHVQYDDGQQEWTSVRLVRVERL